MAKPLTSYAVIGDTRTTALVADDGSIDWWCLPRHDGPAVLTRLLDEHGGAIAVHGTFEAAGRRYEADSNVLRTDLRHAGGLIRLTDFMAVHARPAEATGPDGDAPGLLVRIVEAVEGGTAVELHVRLTPGFGQHVARPSMEDGAVVVRCGDADVYVSASHDLAVEDDRVVLRCTLAAGECAFLSCAYADVRPLAMADVLDHLDATRA